VACTEALAGVQMLNYCLDSGIEPIQVPVGQRLVALRTELGAFTTIDTRMLKELARRNGVAGDTVRCEFAIIDAERSSDILTAINDQGLRPAHAIEVLLALNSGGNFPRDLGIGCFEPISRWSWWKRRVSLIVQGVDGWNCQQLRDNISWSKMPNVRFACCPRRR
jgi:hypothetical protein